MMNEIITITFGKLCLYLLITIIFLTIIYEIAIQITWNKKLKNLKEKKEEIEEFMYITKIHDKQYYKRIENLEQRIKELEKNKGEKNDYTKEEIK